MAQQFNIIVASGAKRASGPNGTPTRAQFSNHLAAPIKLDQPKRWQIALTRIAMPHPGQFESVFVECPLVMQSNVGDQFLPILRVVPTLASAAYFDYEPPHLSWHEITTTYITDVSVTITYGDSLPIPPGLTPQQDFTTISLCIMELV